MKREIFFSDFFPHLLLDVLPRWTRMVVANSYPNFRFRFSGTKKRHDGLSGVVSHAIDYQLLRTCGISACDEKAEIKSM